MADQKVISFLNKLGLTKESSDIYLALLGKTAQTAGQLAAVTKIPKTTIYRRIEELIKLGLVEKKIEEYKKEYFASPADILRLLVIKKEQEARELTEEFPLISKMLITEAQNTDPETKVLYYRGKSGIQQMLWNALKTNKYGLVGYTYRTLTDIVGGDFAKQWNDEFVNRGFTARDLYSIEFIKSKKDPKKQEEGNWGAWKSRYIDPKILDIKHQLDIYNDVVGIYNWHEGDVFGVEIYNAKVADMQRQIFEVLWKLGKKVIYKNTPSV